jgi:hypothetical protein
VNRRQAAVEKQRLRQRPTEDPIKYLGLIVVRTENSLDKYASRLRDVLSHAVDIAWHADFDSDSISVSSLPAWFQGLTNGRTESISGDPVGDAGKAAYVDGAADRRSWDAEEWIYCFDPDLRSWSWWDVTSDQ